MFKDHHRKLREDTMELQVNSQVYIIIVTVYKLLFLLY